MSPLLRDHIMPRPRPAQDTAALARRHGYVALLKKLLPVVAALPMLVDK